MGRGVTLVSSADETAFAVRAEIESGAIPARPSVGRAERRWASSGDPAMFKAMGGQLLGYELGEVRLVQWPSGTDLNA